MLVQSIVTTFLFIDIKCAGWKRDVQNHLELPESGGDGDNSGDAGGRLPPGLRAVPGV